MAKSRKLPYMPFYHGDWKKDIGVQALSFHDRAVWFEMLMLMHESEQRGLLILNNQPMSHDLIAKLINLDNQIFKTSLQNIIDNGVCGVREDGTIYSRKMVRDEELSAKRTISGLKGGNPNLVNQKDKHDSYPNAVIVNDIVNVNDNESNNRLKLTGKFNTPEIKKAVSAWRDKLKKAGRSYDQIQLDANCINFNTPEKFLEALNFSLGLSKTNNLYSPPDKDSPKNKDKPASVSHAESTHPAVRAQRERDAKEALERLGMGGLAK